MTHTLILHIGPHKTATTTIQRGLLAARDFLADHGWHYPMLGLVQAGQHDLQSLFIGECSGTGLVHPDDFARLLREHERIVISSETFSYFEAKPLQALRNAIPATTNIQIVLYARCPTGLWPSHWQETIRQGGHDTLIDHLATVSGFKTLFLPALSNPVIIAARYAAVFGKDCLRIQCYDNIAPTDMLGHFVRNVLGIAAPLPHGEPPRHNPAMPDELIEMLRCLNQRYSETTGDRPFQKLVHAYLAGQSAYEASPDYARFVSAFHEGRSSVTISPQSPFVRQQEKQLMTRFGTRIENRASDENLFASSPSPRTVPYGERYWPLRFGVAEHIDRIFASLSPQHGSGPA